MRFLTTLSIAFVVGLAAFAGSAGAGESSPGSAGTGSVFYAVACPSRSHCVAVGGGIATSTTGGAMWTLQPEPRVLTHQPSVAYLDSVSCLSPTACVAVGEDGIVAISRDGGMDWATRQWLPIANSFYQVACEAPTFCLAVGESSSGSGLMIRTTNGGKTWSNLAISKEASLLSGVACPSPAICYAVGRLKEKAVILATDDGGRSWSTQVTSRSLTSLIGISCSSSSACTVIVSSAKQMFTTDAGKQWSVREIELPIKQSGIACPSQKECLVVGTSPAVPRSSSPLVAFGTSNESVWRFGRIPPSIGLLYALTCNGGDHCVAVGTCLGW